MARQVVQSQEDERARLARDLHDGTSQTLVSTKLLIESAVEQARAGGSPEAFLGHALTRLNDALGEVRGISHRLRPALLDTHGLPSALRHLGSEVAQASGIEIAVPVHGDSARLPEVVDTVLFRIAQEALTNIVKHARAGRIEIALLFEPSADVVLLVTDDGAGFDVDAVQQDPRRGLGLRSMRERLEGIGGTLEIESRPGHGTQVRARVGRGALARLQRLEAAAPDAGSTARSFAVSTPQDAT
jgi:two-component system NarL family sensor kinase